MARGPLVVVFSMSVLLHNSLFTLPLGIINIAPDKKGYPIIFSLISTKTYVVGTY